MHHAWKPLFLQFIFKTPMPKKRGETVFCRNKKRGEIVFCRNKKRGEIAFFFENICVYHLFSVILRKISNEHENGTYF